MQKITNITKYNIQPGYAWANAIMMGMAGQGLNSILSLINQIVYNNNENPLYPTSNVYKNNAANFYFRLGHSPMKTTFSAGSGFF